MFNDYKASKMSSGQSLENLLQNEDLSLENRLKIALSTFTVADLSIIRNKETTLKWLQLQTSSTLSEDDNTAVYSVMKNCINTITDVWLHPQLGDIIIFTLINSKFEFKEILECCVEVLKNLHFQRYFIHNIQKLADLVIFVANKVKTDSFDIHLRNEIYECIVDCLLNVKSNAFYNADLKIVFCNNLVASLAMIAQQEGSVSKSMENCFHEVLFSEADFRNNFTNCILADTRNLSGRSENVINIINSIKNFPEHLPNEILPTAYALIFSGYLLSNSNVNSKFKVFVALNSFVDVCPIQVGGSIPKKVILNETSVCTVHALVEKVYDLPLDSKVDSHTLLDWLNALVDIVLERTNSSLDINSLNLLRSLFNCSPHLMEHCLKKFTKNVMLLRKPDDDDDLIAVYSSLCLDVLNVHIKLNRMHKLISALLVTVNENLNEFSNDCVPDKFEILPQIFFEKIQSAVTNLPNAVQSIALLNTLLYHLEKDCIAKLKENNSKQIDIRLVLLFDLVTYLISRFISGTRIIDHSVPDIVKDKFEGLMQNLGILLGEFGKATISKEHDSKLMESFLHLCLVWGDIQMIFMTYESSRRRIPKQVGARGKSATNLVYLHPYLTDYHWQLIAQRVVNFGNDGCFTLMNNLVLQKIHALPFLEDEMDGPYIDDGPAAICAQFLINQADEKWIFKHVPEFVNFLKPIDIHNLSLSLVKFYRNNETNECFIDEHFQEAKPLVLAMLCATFFSLSKRFYKFDMKELKRIMKKLEYEEMLKAEIGEEDCEEAVENIKKHMDEIGTIISKDFDDIEEVDNIDIQRDIFLLVSLPAPFLSKENKSIVYLLTFSLLKNLIKLRFRNQNVDSSIGDLCQFLLSLKGDIIIPNTLSIKEELPWIYRGVKDIPYRQALMEWLCEINQISIDLIIQLSESSTEKMEMPDFEDSSSNSLDTSFLSTSSSSNLKKLKQYWKLAMKEKNQLTKQRILTKACRMASKHMVINGNKNQLMAVPAMTKTFLDMFKDIIQNKTFQIRYPLIDLCFELISFASNDSLHDENILVDAIELLFSLCKVRMPMLLDRIPAFYMCYKSLFTEIAKRSAVGDCKNLETMTCAAHKLEKLTDVFHKHKKDFTKTAISAVSDLVEVFTEVNIEDSIKIHLKNVVYCWIGICDSHVHQFLTAIIPNATQKLYQQFLNNYNKYYKFSGKV